MVSYKTQFEMAVQVDFEEPEKALKFLVHGNWREVFWEVGGLDDVSELLSEMFHNTYPEFNSTEECLVKDLEGFGEFRLESGGSYVLRDEASLLDTGKITIKYLTELQSGYTECLNV